MKHKIPQHDLLKQADFVVYKDADETITGVVTNLIDNHDWWGGGYYSIVWNQQTWGTSQRLCVSYEEMHRWILANIAKVLPAPNNE